MNKFLDLIYDKNLFFIRSIFYKFKYLYNHFWHRKAFNKKNNPELIKIAFIVYIPQAWNSLKTVYEAALKKTNVKTFLIVLPDNITIIKKDYFSSYDYFSGLYPDAINAYENGLLFDLKKIKPDIVFRQTPYDEVYPKEYSFKSLSKYSKPCYVPYNYNFSAKKHLLIEYNSNMLCNIFAIFSDNHSNWEYCCKKKECFKDIKVFDLGYPRFDLLFDTKELSNDKNIVFTWIPRWSTDGKYNDETGFFKYSEFLINYFKIHKDIYLIIRPHPNMFNHFINSGIMSKEDVENYYLNINQIDNIEMDYNLDYLDTLKKSDVLIADMSSINFEFFLMKKPIIYCGKSDDFNLEGKDMMKSYYFINNKIELEHYLNEMVIGIDQNKEIREDMANFYINKTPKNIGEAIIDTCLKF